MFLAKARSKIDKIIPFPAWCYACQNLIIKKSTYHSLCSDCYYLLPHFSISDCGFCFRSHNSEDCLEASEWGLSSLRSVFFYDRPVSSWLLAFKYGGSLLVGRILQALFAYYWQTNHRLFEDYDVIIPVPSFSKATIPRKLTASFFIGSGANSRRFSTVNASRVKLLPRQSTLNKVRREKNLASRGIFRVDASLSGKKVLLFDDVCTTGATIKNLASEFYSIGARSVGALVFLREWIK